MSMKPIPIIKLLLIVVVGLFLLKLFFGWAANSWPNILTQSANTVVQSA